VAGIGLSVGLNVGLSVAIDRFSLRLGIGAGVCIIFA